MIRLFAAIAIPDEIAGGLMRRQQGLPGARWRPVEAFHVTLRFFGEVSEAKADDIDTELARVSGPKMTLALEGVGSFQEAQEIRAVWAGLAENPALRQLARRCETAARRAGLRAERRSWRPHLTLAYLRGAEPNRVGAWIQSHNLLQSPPFDVTSFGLYSSWLGDDAASYRLEREYPLG